MPTLEITTTVGCPLECTFCPQDAIKSAYGVHKKRLSLDDFRTILSTVPTYVRIDFSGMAEPWVNTDCTAMLRHTLERGYKVAVYTTLVGMKDAIDVVALLQSYAAQVEAVVIHLPDGRGNMRGFKPSGVYKQALQAFCDLAHTGVIGDFRFMAMGAPLKFTGMFGATEVLGFEGCDRAGALDREQIGEQDASGAAHDTPVGCSFTHAYDQNVVMPNGDVVLCCMDYGLKHRIGNLLTGDYWSLFSSPGMNALRVANMRYGCDGSICKKCDRAERYDVTPDTNQYWSEIG